MESASTQGPPAPGTRRAGLRGIRLQFAGVTGVAGIVFGLLLIAVFQGLTEARETRAAQQSLMRTASRIAGRLSGDLLARQHELVLVADMLRVKAVDDPRDLRATLDDLARRERTYAWIGFADPAGRVLASSQGVLQGRDVSARPWFGGALKAPYFGNPHEAVLLARELPAEPGGEPLRFVDVALAVHGADGRLLGVLGGHLYWHWVRDVIGAALGDERRAYPIEVLIADRDGNWLVKPDDEPSRGLAALARRDPAVLVASARSDGVAPTEGLGWTVVVRAPARQVLAGVYADRQWLLWVAIVLSALFSWLSWWVAGRVVRPIERLAREAASLRTDGARTPEFLQGHGTRETRELARVMTDLVVDLQARTAQLALFVEHAPAALAMLDTRLRFLTVSCRWRSDFGIERDVTGLPLADVLPVLPPGWAERHARALEGRHEDAPADPVPMPDGSRRWLRLELRPWFAADGRIGGVMQLVDDVTASRLVQERIAALNADLSERVAAQTAELQAAKTAAESATQAKSAFLASMSHEIRTPMNGVLGLTHLLQRTQLDARQADYVRKIGVSGQHLLGIINNILDLSKIEAGKLALDVREIELDDLLANALGLFTAQAAARGLELVVDVAPDVPARLAGDPLRLGQILINYLSNAVKFTDAGEVQVRVSLRRDAHAAFLRIAVADSGVGMSEEQVRRLFADFEQVGTGNARREGGTGLGLAISGRLAMLMGGTAGASSEPGVGSTFWFELPLHGGEIPPATPSARLSHVLVLEDNASARAAAAHLAEAVAGRVSAVSSVAQARVVLERDPGIDLALVDETLPEQDAFAFARSVAPGHPALGLVLMSPDPEHDGLRAAAVAAGYREVVAKPLRPATLRGLAACVAPGPDVPCAGGPQAAPARQGTPLAGRRVLLAEDNPINRLVAVELMKIHGIEIDTAEDGERAVEKVREGDYQLVFMDIQMPVLDGLEATRAIRRDPGYDTLPIIAMTANAFDSDREACFAAGMNDYISKPIEPEVLARKLDRWLAGAAS